MTVREFYLQVYFPLRRAYRSVFTDEQYRNALARWRCFLGREPALGDFTDENLAKLVEWMAAQEKSVRYINDGNGYGSLQQD